MYKRGTQYFNVKGERSLRSGAAASCGGDPRRRDDVLMREWLPVGEICLLSSSAPRKRADRVGP